MKNSEVQKVIAECLSELKHVKAEIKRVGATDMLVPILTRYAVIKACGSIELGFKTLLSDVHNDQSQQIKNFIDHEIRNNSMNPSLDNIHRTLNKFDEAWNDNFKKKLNNLPTKVKTSIKSLNAARNTFAHGGNPSCTFDDVTTYFNDSVRVLRAIDAAIS